MPMTARGLTKLIDECGELIQVAGKKLAYYRTDTHPDGEGSLKVRLEDEIADVMAACRLVTRLYGLDRTRILLRTADKIDLFEKWHADPNNNEDGIDALECRFCPGCGAMRGTPHFRDEIDPYPCQEGAIPLGSERRVVRKILSEKEARGILREYPDADLGAFIIESDKTADQLAAEEVSAVMETMPCMQPVTEPEEAVHYGLDCVYVKGHEGPCHAHLWGEDGVCSCGEEAYEEKGEVRAQVTEPRSPSPDRAARCSCGNLALGRGKNGRPICAWCRDSGEDT